MRVLILFFLGVLALTYFRNVSIKIAYSFVISVWGSDFSSILSSFKDG